MSDRAGGPPDAAGAVQSAVAELRRRCGGVIACRRQEHACASPSRLPCAEGCKAKAPYNVLVSSKHRALYLLFAVLWQTLAWLSPVYLDHQREVIAHMVVHAQEVDHHHHADQTLHMEEDGSEPPHQHAHQAVQVPGLPPVMALVAGDPVPSVLVPHAIAGHASVFLDSPLRPPRRSAALA